ncbi:MAG: DUF6861 domain-containing protein [Bryobacteraceae bacterium]
MPSSKIIRHSLKKPNLNWRQVYVTGDGDLAHPSAPDSSGVFHAPTAADHFFFSGVPHPQSPAGQRLTAHDLGFLDELEREACIVESCLLAPIYLPEYLPAETGRDVTGLGAMVPALLESLRLLAATTLAGAAGGAVAGTPFFGVGAVPGAIFGAEAGLDAGLYLLFLAGVPALAQYVKDGIGQVIALVQQGIAIAWNAPDSDMAQLEIERAARRLAQAIAVWCRIVLEAVVLYLLGKGAAGAAHQLIELTGDMRQAGYGALANTVAAEGESLVKDPKLKPKTYSVGGDEGSGSSESAPARQKIVASKPRPSKIVEDVEAAASIVSKATPINGAIRTVPLGFKSEAQFAQATAELQSALKASGINDAVVGVRGSSVTGGSLMKGTTFGPQSDIDFFVESAKLTEGYTPSKSIPGFVNPNKILPDYPLLQDWSAKWTGILGREITPGGFAPGTLPAQPAILVK